MPEVELATTEPSHTGGAIARLEEKVHFVSYALPGERVLARVYEQKPSYARASALTVVSDPHEGRTSPACPYFGRCGGCSWQHATYQLQLDFKTATVRDLLRKIGGFENPPVQPMIGAASPFHYRNQARLSVRRDRTLGYAREHTSAVMTIEHCHLLTPRINELVASMQGHVHGKTHQVLIRHSDRTGSTLVSPPLLPSDELWHEELLGKRYRVSANSFFQVNTVQADILVQLALDRLAASSSDVVLDAYAGVGTFALQLAPRVKEVIAIEEAATAIADARANAEGLSTVQILHGRVENVLPNLDATPNAVILDPARPGCAPPVLEALLARKPRRIVYVSCDPSTLARDLRTLADGGYALVEVQPVDMFPQTYHVECVATLER